MATIERHPVRRTALLGPPGEIPTLPDALATRGRNNTSEKSQNGSSTNTPLKAKRPTDETAPAPALKGSTEGKTARVDQAVTSNSQTSIANIGRSTRPTQPIENTKDLEYRRKRDRILSLNMHAFQDIALKEEEQFPEECMKHLDRLVIYLKKEGGFKDEGHLSFIPCMGKRTESTDNPDTLVPYIRIRGLTTHRDIKAMNVVLSKSKVRSLYHPPIRICYELFNVDASSSFSAVSTLYAPSKTLCGTLSVIEQEKIQRTVTIGGLIKVADRLYAITASHTVSHISEEPSRTSSSLSDDITIGDINDYDDDVEPALVIERETEESSSHGGKSSPTFTSTQTPAGVEHEYSGTLGTIEDAGLEWSLIRIQNPSLQLPNFAVSEEDLKTGTGSTPSARTYISIVAEAPSSITVAVLAGASGQVKARLLPNAAYTRLPSGDFVQTWTLSFEDGTGLRKGDSGSWVVDPTSGVLYGHVIAISQGYAFIRPTKDVFREIKDTFKADVVQLPTPFDLLAELSKLGSERSQPNQADDFAKQSIAADALLHSFQSSSANIIQEVLREKHSIDEAVLCRILQATGSDVIGALRKSEVWDAARSGSFGEKETSVQVLKSLSQEAKIPINLGVLNPNGYESGGPSNDDALTIEIMPIPPTRPKEIALMGNADHPFDWREKQSPTRTQPRSEPHVSTKEQTRSLQPPFSRMTHLPVTVSQYPQPEDFPTIVGHGHEVFIAFHDFAGFLRLDLDLTRLNRIHGHLWLAGRPMRARPLHKYKLCGLDIRCTQQMDLHLLKTKNYLMLKPLPSWIFDHEFWRIHIVCDQGYHASATGFLMSYVWLLTTPIDFKIAQDLALVHGSITWEWWKEFVFDFLGNVSIDTLSQVNKRYEYGDLRLDRINMIYRCRFITTHLVRGYFLDSTSSITPLLLFGFVFFNIVLSAMQVGSSVPGLEDNYAFQRASYVFVVFSIVSLVALVGLVGFVFVAIQLFNKLHAFADATWRSRTRKARWEKEA